MADGQGLLLFFIIISFQLLSIEMDALSGDFLCNERCCSNYKAVNGKCVECPPGSYGVNCSQSPCPNNHYGRFCLAKCNCTDKQMCNHVNGECICASSASCGTTKVVTEDVAEEVTKVVMDNNNSNDEGEKSEDLLIYLTPGATGGGLIYITVVVCCFYYCHKRSRRQVRRQGQTNEVNARSDTNQGEPTEAHYMIIRSSQMISNINPRPQVNNDVTDYDCASRGRHTCVAHMATGSNSPYNKIQEDCNEYNILSLRKNADETKPKDVAIPIFDDENFTDIKTTCKLSCDDRDHHTHLDHSRRSPTVPYCVELPKLNIKGGNSKEGNGTEKGINPFPRHGDSKNMASTNDNREVPLEGVYSLSKGNNCDEPSQSRRRAYSFAKGFRE